MSRRVIKAGQVRYVETEPGSGAGKREESSEERADRLPADRPDHPDQQADSLKQAIEEAKRLQQEEFKAAYDELIAAAQDEVALRMEDARAQAQEIVAEARVRSESIRHEAFETGLAEGKAQAQEETAELLRQAQEEAGAILQKAEQERLRIAEETQPKMYRLALDIAGKILKYELDENQDAYMGILRNAMNHVRTEGPVTLHVNAAEFTRQFGSQDKAKLRTDEGMVSADVVVDPSVEPGGCLIETDSGVVDASVGVQLEQIAQSLGLGEVGS